MVTYLEIARDILTEEPVSLAEYPPAQLESWRRALMRRALLEPYAWREERRKQSLMARMIPGALSVTTGSGSPRPRARMSW